MLDTWEVRPQPTVPVTDLPCLSTPQAKIHMFIECHQCTSDRICSDECLNELYMAMEYTPDEIREIDIATRGQHLNPNWFLLRKYLLTASRFKTICHNINWTKTAVSLLNGNSYVSDDMEFGNRFEGSARDLFLKSHRYRHKNCHIEVPGFVVNNNYPYIGASPDEIFHCNECDPQIALLEVKCFGRKKSFSHHLPFC